MKYFTKEVKIAIVAIVGLVVLFLGMNFLKGLDLFSTDNRYYISFRDISCRLHLLFMPMAIRWEW